MKYFVINQKGKMEEQCQDKENIEMFRMSMHL